MKIVVKNQNHPYKRELRLLFALFQERGDELFFSDQPNTLEFLEVNCQISNTHIIATVQGELNGDQLFRQVDRKLGIDGEENRKIMKRAVSIVWLQTLMQATEKLHSYGILTGMRPTKLYHMLLKSHTYQEVDAMLKEEYLLAEDKIALLREIVERQLKIIPDLDSLDQEVSIYIGIPFCPTRCAYCTFPAYSLEKKGRLVEDFLSGLHQEIAAIGNWLNQAGLKVTTLYLGGGTPTSITAKQLDEIFYRLSFWLDLSKIREITVEAGRPDTITLDKLNVLKKWQVGRISINPQSFNQKTLDLIGRRHSIAEILEKYQLARDAGFSNINMDLIIGLPGEGLKELAISLDYLEQLRPEALSIHTMALKRASYLTRNKEDFPLTDSDEVVRMMEHASKWCRTNHYQPYYLYRQKNMLGNLENVGYSQIGQESLYNILIMEEKQTIIGLGSGAVSKLVPPESEEVFRLPSPKDPVSYIKSVAVASERKLNSLNKIFKKFS